jgi:hypothetical protein
MKTPCNLALCLAVTALFLAPLALPPGAGTIAARAADSPKVPVEVAGKVVSGAGARSRHLQVQAGPVEVTLNVQKSAWVEKGGKKISVHDVKPGTYIRAQGQRMGNTRVDTDHIWVIGDRLDFMNSSYGKMKGEQGYVRKI